MSGNGNGRSVPPEIIGGSPAIRRAVEVLERYAKTRLPVLLVGATGTGKELFAEYLHWRSGRPGRLVPVNCAALPRDTAESLLFGHRKGSFTGAIESRPGYFRLAHHGTLFLDELLSMPLECQAKLLRTVESGEVWPLGESEPVPVDVRIVAATQDDAAAQVQAGSLRRDLYRRLVGVVLELPPLAARPEDVVPLARSFAALAGLTLAPGAEAELRAHCWPDNVRELRQTVERAAPLAEDGVLSAATLQEAIRLGTTGPQTDPPMAPAREHILRTCAAHGWHAGRAAAALGISRTTLRLRLKEWGLSLRSIKKAALGQNWPVPF